MWSNFTPSHIARKIINIGRALFDRLSLDVQLTFHLFYLQRAIKSDASKVSLLIDFRLDIDSLLFATISVYCTFSFLSENVLLLSVTLIPLTHLALINV